MVEAKKLNLGSGQRKIKGALNVDFNLSSKPDRVCNLNKFPYPFKKDQFNEVFCYDILEHLDDLISVMKELYRVTKNGAKIVIESPHFSSANAFTDPTHKHFFSAFSFDYFTGENEWHYYLEGKFCFKTLERTIVFAPDIMNKFRQKFFNNHKKLYESKYAWRYPSQKIRIVLETVKAPKSPSKSRNLPSK